jgi:site-specific DNA-adenine methylase
MGTQRQLPLLPEYSDEMVLLRPVNVASVPQRSPFRYPGGKKAGKRLYKHHELDHERLFTICESLVGDFLMTYDEAEEVKEMARRHMDFRCA